MKEVTGAELEELIGSGKTVVCDFWASWCGPCRMLAPIVEKLSEEFKGSAEFVKLNIDEETETAVRYGVMAIPDIFVFADGKVRAHNLGYAPEEELRLFLGKNI